MHNLIITADDYGMSEAVNQGIEEGIKAGILTSTNLMTNMPFCNAAADFKKRFPGVSLGLHWNLTCGYPLTSAKAIPTLVQQNGRFHTYSVFRSLYRSGKISDDEIAAELSAQAREFVRITGQQPDYWNTHENVHVDFNIYFLFASIASDAKKLGIEKAIMTMRSHQRIYVSPKGKDSPLSLKWRIAEPIKSRMLNQWQGKLRSQGFCAPEGRLVYLNKSDQNDIPYVVNHIRWKKDKDTAEMVFHPAVAIDSEFFGEMCENRLVEYHTVTTKAFAQAIRDAGCILVNYAGECAPFV